LTTGPTLEETREKIKEAIQGHRETLREFGNPVLEPASVAGEVEVMPAA
jgi:predicted RNase H-like HicB family nuclease